MNADIVKKEIAWERQAYAFEKLVIEEIIKSNSYSEFIKIIELIRNNVISNSYKLKNCELALLSLYPNELADITIRALAIKCYDFYMQGGNFRLEDAVITLGKECEFRFKRNKDNRIIEINDILTKRRQDKNKSKIKTSVKGQLQKLENEWNRDNIDIHIGGLICSIVPVYLKDFFKSNKISIYKVINNGEEEVKTNEVVKQVRIIEFSNKIKLFIANKIKRKNVIQTKFLPTLIPPKNWTNYDNGGYYNNDINLNFVKDKGSQIIKKNLEKIDLSNLFESVNIIQNTRWKINKNIFDYILFAHKSKLSKYFRKCEDENRVKKMEKQIQLAKKLIKKDGFYFPYNLDFRGRVFSISTLISPQGDDIGKALLLFHSALEIKKETVSEYWLKIYIANTSDYHLERRPFDERIKWVDENEERIILLAKKPFEKENYGFWLPNNKTSDKSWRFLSACVEWEKYKISLRKGKKYFSNLPIYIDGSCNGIQHLSALSCDVKAAQATNIFSNHNKKPCDIYLNIAQQILLQDSSISLSDNEKRKIVKPIVMNYAYGQTIFTATDIIKEKLKEYKFSDYSNPTCNKLAKEIRKVIESEYPKIKDILEKFRYIGCQMKDKEILWDTPSGFRVIHYYPEYKLEKIRITLPKIKDAYYNLKNYILEIETKRAKMVKKLANKHKSALAPNFVHSMDASHLIMVVNKCSISGIKDIGIVHDSFATHSQNIEILSKILREQFFNLYNQNILLKFLKGETSNIEPEIKSIHIDKDFDIEEVLSSSYLFS